MAEITLTAETRDALGKNASRRIRRNGRVPAIVYGGPDKNVNVSVDPKMLLKVIRSEAGRNAILKLEIAGQGATNAILKGWQVDPVKENFLHADFYRIAMDVAIRVTVPIIVRGEARGVKVDGGMLELVMRQVEVECLPGDIPERIEVEVTGLGLNESLRVSDLPVSEKIEILQSPNSVVVHVISVKEEAAPTTGAAPVEAVPAAAEPEISKKGKKEDEGT